jgi:hypothetical protein
VAVAGLRVPGGPDTGHGMPATVSTTTTSAELLNRLQPPQPASPSRFSWARKADERDAGFLVVRGPYNKNQITNI